MKTFRLLSATISWRFWLKSWIATLAFGASMVGLLVETQSIDGIFRWTCLLLYTAGSIGTWLPATDAGSTSEFLALRLPSRRPLLAFHAVRQVGAGALTILLLSWFACHNRTFDDAARLFGMSLGCYLLPGMLAIGLQVFTTGWQWGTLLPMMGIMVVGDSLESASRWLGGPALLAVNLGILAIGSCSFLSVEFQPRHPRNLDFDLPSWRRSLFNPAFTTAAAPLRYFLKRGFWGFLFIGGVLATLCGWTKAIKDDAAFPWRESVPWPYFLIGLILGLVVRVPAHLSDEQAHFFFGRGIDLPVLHRERVRAEMRLLIAICSFAGVGMALLAQPLVGLVYAGFFALWGTWTLFMIRRPHLRIGWLTLLLLIPTLIATGSKWTPNMHLGMAAMAVLMTLTTWGNYRRYLADTEALRKNYLTVSTQPGSAPSP